MIQDPRWNISRRLGMRAVLRCSGWAFPRRCELDPDAEPFSEYFGETGILNPLHFGFDVVIRPQN